MNTPHRPWPVLLLTALGAWLSAVPLVAMVGILLGDVLTRGIGPYACGVLILVGAMVVLRSREVPLFLEQLAVPALLVGGGTLGFGLFRDFDEGAGALLLAIVPLLMAALVAQPWLRLLMGALAAGLVVFGVMEMGPWPRHELWRSWWALHTLLMAWALGWAWVLRLPENRREAAASAMDTAGAGWLLTILCGLAVWSGMSFMMGGAVGLQEAGRGGSTAAFHLGGVLAWLPAAASVGLSLLAGAALARHWPVCRRPAVLAAMVVLAALAAWLPTLGAAWLILAALVLTHRWRLAVAAALSAAWIIGSFYYQLDWPLAVKSVWLLGSGLLLGLLAWVQGRPSGQAAPQPYATGQPPAHRLAPALVGASLLATLALVNVGIWQKEDLIARGQPVFVALAPVDPRSLMQGDYMQLAFQLPAEVGELSPGLAERPQVVLARDARGLAVVRRLHRPGQALGEGEQLMELTPSGGRWTLVSDAWFFKEGQAARWADKARYGDFRVLPDGRALLVGLADEHLQPIP